MDTRNIQKTGDMFYLYLPTRWCKGHNIGGQSKVSIHANSDGSLSVYPHITEKKPVHLKIKASGVQMDSLHKLIIACYTSPANSFQITLDKELDFTKILSQKNVVSLELIEMSGNTITCESSLQISDPLQLLSTMVRKVKNLLLVVMKRAPKALLERYEEEIDRNKLLIEKSIIANLVEPAQSKQKPIDLHFIALISKELEHMADHLILLKKPQEQLLKELSQTLKMLKELLDDDGKLLQQSNVMPFLDKISAIQSDKQEYNLHRISRSLNAISEVIVDWAVVREGMKS